MSKLGLATALMMAYSVNKKSERTQLPVVRFTLPNGQWYELRTGLSGRFYAVFPNANAAWENLGFFSYYCGIACYGEYDNAICLED